MTLTDVTAVIIYFLYLQEESLCAVSKNYKVVCYICFCILAVRCQGQPFGEDRHFYGQSGVEKFMSVKCILSFIS